MENKDYIEIYDENNQVQKKEIVMTFDNPNDSQYTYIIYKNLEDMELFGGKIRKAEDAVLETNLSDEEKVLLEKALENALKQ